MDKTLLQSIILLKDNSVREVEKILSLKEDTLRKLFKKNNLPSPSSFRGIKISIDSLSKNEKEKILYLYDNFFGKSKTIKQISNELNIPDNIVKSFIKDLNITHETSLKSTIDHENISKEIDKIISFKKNKLSEDKIKNEIIKNSEKWIHWKQEFLKPFYDKCINLKHENFKHKKCSNNNLEYCIVLPIQDFHWGKVSNYNEIHKSSQNNFSLLKERLILSTSALISNVKKFGKAEALYLTIGGDFYNIDTWSGTTTSGTPQDNENTLLNILISGMMLMVSYIQFLIEQDVAEEIVLVPTPGNHDRATSVSLYIMLCSWFLNNYYVKNKFKDNLNNYEEINFENFMNVSDGIDISSRQYEKYGNTLLVFSHGDGVKAEELPIIIAQEAREMWGETNNCAFFNGHFHHKVVKEHSGVIQFQVSSLSGSDRWHNNKGYTSSNKALSMFLFDKENGYFCELFGKVNV